MKNIVKKVLMMILTMVIVSFFAFLAFQIIPGDPTTKILGADATAEAVEALRAELGIDRPFFVRYFEWITNALQGDFGRSYIYDMSVAELLQGKMTVTLLLTAIAFV
ncbi:MAG: ABC transporter permease, partial [Oscillospiraceae bacterium]|nr:ABC transporter permease [Oscillospiraceae bacterium]